MAVTRVGLGGPMSSYRQFGIPMGPNGGGGGGGSSSAGAMRYRYGYRYGWVHGLVWLIAGWRS